MTDYKSISYKYEDLGERVKEMNKGDLVLSNQYGMLFILNSNGEIILNVTSLVSKEERMKHA